jgi:Protein of unknown function (DUF1587)/Planctomycete cytochrome C
MPLHFPSALLLPLLLAAPLGANTPASAPAASAQPANATAPAPTTQALFAKHAKPYLETHCYDCHDDSMQKGGVRLDNLTSDFTGPASASLWAEVFEQISRGTMPPKNKPRPPAATSTAMGRWISQELIAHETSRRTAGGRVVLRRLNRVEYQNTIRDLLGVEEEVADLLPEDASVMGFDNISAALNVSTVLMERYLEAAEAALDAALPTGPRPETRSWSVPMGPKIAEEKRASDYRMKEGVRLLPGLFQLRGSPDFLRPIPRPRGGELPLPHHRLRLPA